VDRVASAECLDARIASVSHFPEWQIFSTDEGIRIDESDERSANADSSIQKSCEPDSNLTVTRESLEETDNQRNKAYVSERSEQGTQTDEVHEQLDSETDSAKSSIHPSLECQARKQSLESLPTDDGIPIDATD
jgi:hypothetical protein